ncbi:hypothetical protein LCGC14_1947990, partial [marine sediment metagenome]
MTKLINPTFNLIKESPRIYSGEYIEYR